MTRTDRCVHGLLICLLGLWCALVLAAGLTAALVFSNLGPLEPSSATFEGYPQPHQWRHIAGIATDGGFRIADWAALACIPLTLGLLLWQLRRGSLGWRSVIDQIKLWATVAAAAVTIIRWIGPQQIMDRSLDVEQSALAEHDWIVAEQAQAAFLRVHDVAATLWETAAGLLVIAFIASVWAGVRRQ
ncbi:MAG: hypothetical protein MK101_03825 [Phycisphaerales bacterium]|nr:hypothetical protein [Phycisphaerales bacterium]